MSKPFPVFSLASLALTLLFSPTAFCQQISATLDVTGDPSPRVAVRLQTPSRRQLSFRSSVANAADLSARVSGLKLSDSPAGGDVAYRTIAPGEYLAEKDFTTIAYEVSLSPAKARGAAAHASWLKGDVGILMLADVLPIHASGSVTISFTQNSPPASSIHIASDQRSVSLTDAENAVFYIGSGWRVRASAQCRPCPILFISDTWHFTDDEARNLVVEITELYEKQYRTGDTRALAGIAIAKYPVPTQPGSWDAETRGRDVMIISSDMPFKTQSVQRLHEQLRHEIFHLWIPKSVNLTGSYDWFYEGFALYQSLKLAVGVNRIRFEDFLDTLSRAHTIDSAIPRKVSLIQASANRFGGSNTQVYARGMLVAFLSDVQLLQRSKGKLSVEDILLELTRKHGKSLPAADGNASVIKILRDQAGAGRLVDRYVQGIEAIDLAIELGDSGIEDSDPGPITNLRIKSKLNGSQKSLLDKLGYNNWRNLPRTAK